MRTEPSIEPQNIKQRSTFLIWIADILISLSSNIITHWQRLDKSISILFWWLCAFFASFNVNIFFVVSLNKTVASDNISTWSLGTTLGSVGSILAAVFFLRDLNENLALGVNSAFVVSKVSVKSLSCCYNRVSQQKIICLLCWNNSKFTKENWRSSYEGIYSVAFVNLFSRLLMFCRISLKWLGSSAFNMSFDRINWS